MTTSIADDLPPVGIRWTIGDVSRRGFDALQLSIWGAWRIFGARASYAVCVNTVSLQEARRRTGAVPAQVAWHDATPEVPAFLRVVLGNGMAQGAGWKLAPLHCFPKRHELALDNDCILWELPSSVRDWLSRPVAQAGCLLAEDVRPSYGQFATQCPPRALNAGIRGLPPGLDLGALLRAALEMRQRNVAAPLAFTSELDEQGLQVAALSLAGPSHMVPLQDVTVCSPFHPHLPDLGRCGAHFVGLNARTISWDYYGRPADLWMTEHWARHVGDLEARTGTPPPFELSGLAAAGSTAAV